MGSFSLFPLSAFKAAKEMELELWDHKESAKEDLESPL